MIEKLGPTRIPQNPAQIYPKPPSCNSPAKPSAATTMLEALCEPSSPPASICDPTPPATNYASKSTAKPTPSTMPPSKPYAPNSTPQKSAIPAPPSASSTAQSGHPFPSGSGCLRRGSRRAGWSERACRQAVPQCGEGVRGCDWVLWHY